jgi:hypothetical protein
MSAFRIAASAKAPRVNLSLLQGLSRRLGEFIKLSLVSAGRFDRCRACSRRRRILSRYLGLDRGSCVSEFRLQGNDLILEVSLSLCER